MKKFSTILIISILALFLAAGSAMAVPFNANVSSPQLTQLQTVFDEITDDGNSSIDVYSDESQNEIYAFQTDTANSTYLVNTPYSWAAGDYIFGLYEIGNTTNNLVLYDTSLNTGDPGDSTKTYIDFTNDSMESYSMVGGHHTIDTANAMSTFGFYTQWTDSNNTTFTHYSVSDDNANGYDYFLTYLAKGDMVDPDGDGTYLNDANHWYVAGEVWDTTGFDYDPSQYDFTDIVVQFESIHPVPVPEPATMLLFGTGLIGLASFGRKKFFKNS